MPQFLVPGQVRLKNGVCKLPMAIAKRLSTSENDFDNAWVCVGGLDEVRSHSAECQQQGWSMLAVVIAHH